MQIQTRKLVKSHILYSKPPLVDEHAFSPTEFAVAWLGCSLRLLAAVGYCQLPDRSCLTHVVPRSRLRASLIIRGINVTVCYTLVNSNSKVGEVSKCRIII